MSGLFELNCYLIGLTSVAATFFVLECSTHSSEIMRRLYAPCAYGYWELNKRVHFKKVLTFVCIWTALIGLASGKLVVTTKLPI